MYAIRIAISRSINRDVKYLNEFLNIKQKYNCEGLLIYDIGHRHVIWNIISSIEDYFSINSLKTDLFTDAYNKIIGTDNIYAIGVTCLMTTDPEFPYGHPQLAKVAFQQANQLAKDLIASDIGKNLRPFKYNDRGYMAIIRRNRAVDDLKGPVKHFNGFVAWLIWILIHLMSSINFRNKVTTLFNWYNSYLTREQPLRMIVNSKRNASSEDH